MARVSFPGLDRPVPVAANKLRLRVMPDAIPEALKQVDKVSPDERCELVENFWELLGREPFESGQPPVDDSFWNPAGKAIHLDIPDLKFGKKKVLPGVNGTKHDEKRQNYRKRLALLNKAGCFDVPPAIPRQIYFQMPDKVGEPALICRLWLQMYTPQVI